MKKIFKSYNSYRSLTKKFRKSGFNLAKSLLHSSQPRTINLQIKTCSLLSHVRSNIWIFTAETDLWFPSRQRKRKSAARAFSRTNIFKFMQISIHRNHLFLYAEDGRQNINAQRIISISAKQFIYSWDCHRGCRWEKKGKVVAMKLQPCAEWPFPHKWYSKQRCDN